MDDDGTHLEPEKNKQKNRLARVVLAILGFIVFCGGFDQGIETITQHGQIALGWISGTEYYSFQEPSVVDQKSRAENAVLKDPPNASSRKSRDSETLKADEQEKVPSGTTQAIEPKIPNETTTKSQSGIPAGRLVSTAPDPRTEKVNPSKLRTISHEKAQKRYQQGMSFLGNKKELEAIVEFRAAIRLDSNYIEAYTKLAETYEHRGMKESAERTYTERMRIPEGRISEKGE